MSILGKCLRILSAFVVLNSCGNKIETAAPDAAAGLVSESFADSDKLVSNRGARAQPSPMSLCENKEFEICEDDILKRSAQETLLCAKNTLKEKKGSEDLTKSIKEVLTFIEALNFAAIDNYKKTSEIIAVADGKVQAGPADLSRLCWGDAILFDGAEKLNAAKALLEESRISNNPAMVLELNRRASGLIESVAKVGKKNCAAYFKVNEQSLALANVLNRLNAARDMIRCDFATKNGTVVITEQLSSYIDDLENKKLGYKCIERQLSACKEPVLKSGNECARLWGAQGSLFPVTPEKCLSHCSSLPDGKSIDEADRRQTVLGSLSEFCDERFQPASQCAGPSVDQCILSCCAQNEECLSEAQKTREKNCRTVCKFDDFLQTDCTAEIPGSRSAYRLQVCEVSGKAFALSGSCILEACQQGYSRVGNRCENKHCAAVSSPTNGCLSTASDKVLPAPDESKGEKLAAEKLAAEKKAAEKLAAEKLAAEKLAAEKLAAEKLAAEKLAAEKLAAEKQSSNKTNATVLTPSKPRNVSGQIKDFQLSLRWLAPLSRGGSAIKQYKVRYRDKNSLGNNWYEFTTPTSSNLSVNHPMSIGPTYVFQVAAVNSAGIGDYSDELLIRTVPSAPRDLIVNLGKCQVIKNQESGSSSVLVNVSLKWSPPLEMAGDPIVDYEIKTRVKEGYINLINPRVSAATNSASGYLPCDGTVKFEVIARTKNLGGEALASDLIPITNVRAIGAPTKPESLSISANGMKFEGRTPRAYVSLSWKMPSDSSNQKITNYSVQMRNIDRGETRWTDVEQKNLVATNITINDLICAETYQFRVAAASAQGIGEFSEPSASISTPCVPNNPISLDLTSGDQSVSVQWPGFPGQGNNGSPIIGYHLQYSIFVNYEIDGWLDFPHTQVDTNRGRYKVNVTGLKNGTPYRFRVAFINSIGKGEFTESDVIVPFGLPNKPMNLAVRPGFQQAYLSWTPPSDNGRPITNYSIKYSTDGGTSWSQPVLTNEPNFVYEGLTIGLSYIFQVAARNERGEGLPSENSPPLTVAANGDRYCEIDVTIVGGLSCQGNDKNWDVRKRLECSGCGGNMYGGGTYWFSGSYPVTLPDDAEEIEAHLETDPINARGTGRPDYRSGFNRVILQLGNSTLENAVPMRVDVTIDDRGRPTGYPLVWENANYKPIDRGVDLKPGKNTFKMTVNPIGCIWDRTISRKGGNYEIYSGGYKAKIKGRYKAAQCNKALEGPSPSKSNKNEPVYFNLRK